MPTYEVTLTATIIIRAENVAQAHALAQSEEIRVTGTGFGIKGRTKKDRNRYSYQRTIWNVKKSLPVRISPWRDTDAVCER